MLFCYPKRIFHLAGSFAGSSLRRRALFASVFRAGQSRIWPKPSPVPSRSLQNWPKPTDKARIGTEHKVRQRRGKHRARAAVTTKSNAIYFLVTVKLIATAMARRYRYQRFGPGSYTEKILYL